MPGKPFTNKCKQRALKFFKFRALCLHLAVWTRLELATSAVTGRHSNQLNYQTSIQAAKIYHFSEISKKNQISS